MSESDKSNELPQSSSVPVYSCTIYVKSLADGRVAGRCANLSGFDAEAATEPELLRAIISHMKSELARMNEEDAEVPWLEEKLPIEEGESERFTVLHL